MVWINEMVWIQVVKWVFDSLYYWLKWAWVQGHSEPIIYQLDSLCLLRTGYSIHPVQVEETFPYVAVYGELEMHILLPVGLSYS